MKCRLCRAAGGHRRAAPQCRVLPRCFVEHCRNQVATGHRRAQHDRPRRACARRRVRAVRTPSPCGTCSSRSGYRADGPLHRARHRAATASRRRVCARQVRPPRTRPPGRGRPALGLRLSTCAAGRPPFHRVPCSACGLSKRHIFDRSHHRGRLRRRRHGPQPRRRGRRTARQRPALGPRLPGPPAPGPAGRGRLPAQGQAAGAPRRAGNGRLLRPARYRLPGRGVPDGGGQQAPRLQRRPQRDRGAFARHQSRVLLRFPGAGYVTGRPSGRAGARGTARLPELRGAHDRKLVRLLPAGRARAGGEPAGGQPGGRREAVRARRAGAPLRLQGPPLPRHPGRQAASSTPTPGSSPTTRSWARRKAPPPARTAVARYIAVRPTLAEVVLKMPRGRRSSTRRTSAPSSSWPTSSRVPTCSKRVLARARAVDDFAPGRCPCDRL